MKHTVKTKFTFTIKSMALFLMLFTVLIATSGCKASNEIKADSSKSEFTIVTSFYPMYLFTQNIVGDTEGVQVVNMTEPQTGCLHDYQLTTKDMKVLEKANVFVINGAGMEAFLQKVADQRSQLTVIEAAKGIPLITDSGTNEPNPHVWVSISHAITEVNNIAKGLAKADPKHKDVYLSNAQKYVTQLEAQKKKMHQALDGLMHRDIVTFHEAFPYFAQEFSLNILTVIEREPGSEPSAKELSQTLDLIESSGVNALFVEPQYSPKAAQIISNESGKKLYTLDPVTTGSTQDSKDAYIQIMDANLKALTEALK